MESKYFKGQTDSDYLQFNKKLVTSAFPMQGVRLPAIRKTAKTLVGDAAFLDMTPTMYEDVMLLGFVLGLSNFDIDTLLSKVDRFLPLVDNWAVCDSFTACLKKFSKHKPQVFAHFAPLKDAPQVYYRRFLAVLLMDYFFTPEYIDGALDLLLEIRTGEYYVDMAVAWALATAAAKHFDKVYAIIAGGSLSPFIYKKSISKSLESFRLTAEQKEALRKLRQNNL